MSQILDGRPVRARIFEGLKPRLAALKRPPGLAVVLVGSDAASAVYVRNKIKACEELGILGEQLTPPAGIGMEELLKIINDLNHRPDIDGILVQFPLPRHLDERRVLEAVAPHKDVDGFHPINAGHLMAGRPAPRACTPSGIIEMLKYYHIDLDGRRAVIIGRSNIVGKPLALMLLEQNATVTICHSRTANLAEECRQADILVAAVGKPALVTGEFIAPGATVIDVGLNRITDRAEAERVGKAAEFERNGSALVGDVHPLEVRHAASAFTPVPGGVGPLTIAMLMSNTVMLSERNQCSE